MTARPVSRDEAISLGRIDPAASAYGAHLRRKGILRRCRSRSPCCAACSRLPLSLPPTLRA
ncbi:hypothetical protein BV511_08535 [Methylorubrum extorquens]|nr:hypothetical protein BV511_08535 [Methylorubrum extorquens]